MKTKDQLKDMELPAGTRERYVTGVNGLTVHVLEAGPWSFKSQTLLYSFYG
ncbi:hypothetical protein [Mucilaginibacter frigoritolerans]|nr:hypothetical protein [Mucilaginibacter frigoritolerans]